MKTRVGFVSNSSSTSFLITNHGREPLTLVDFVTKNPKIIQDWISMYAWIQDGETAESEGLTQEALLKGAEDENITFAAGETLPCVFGDEDGTLIGRVFDYMLRDGGHSLNFEWNYNDSHR